MRFGNLHLCRTFSIKRKIPKKRHDFFGVLFHGFVEYGIINETKIDRRQQKPYIELQRLISSNVNYFLSNLLEEQNLGKI